MSVDRTFSISLAERKGEKLSAVSIIGCFLEFGWNLYSSQGKIYYTDVGDDDYFNYVEKRITEEEYFNIVEQKEAHGEIISFALHFMEKSDRFRMIILITPKYEIILSPDDETRKMLVPNLNILDVNWYFNKILPPLLKSDFIIGSFSYSQY